MKASRHWWYQRVSAIVLLPLALVFVIAVARSLGLPQAQVVAIWSGPAHALIAIAFFVVLFIHLQQGLHEVIIDYVHGPSRGPALLAVKAACILLPAIVTLALLRLAFFQDT